MTYQEAYKKLKKKFPDKQCGGYLLIDDEYVFPLFPLANKLSKFKAEDFEVWDDTWSVNKNTGEINSYGLMSDPFRLARMLELKRNGKLIEGEFIEKDIL